VSRLVRRDLFTSHELIWTFFPRFLQPTTSFLSISGGEPLFSLFKPWASFDLTSSSRFLPSLGIPLSKVHLRSFPSLPLASHISTDSSSLHFFRNLDQAFDRAHRLGQTRDVEIYKLAIEESVEDRILELQDKKRELAAAALSGDKFKAGNKLGLEDIMALFKVSPVRFYLAEMEEKEGVRQTHSFFRRRTLC